MYTLKQMLKDELNTKGPVTIAMEAFVLVAGTAVIFGGLYVMVLIETGQL